MYAKLFSSLLSSSVWSEDSDTCKVWITMIALADREGFVFGSPSGIARICALPVEKVEAAIEKFVSPDQHSSDKTREPDRDGRRVEVVDGGWVLLNYAHYRDLSDAEVRRSQYRSSKRRIRGLSKNVHTGQHRSTRVHPSESSSEAEPEESTFGLFWDKYPRRVKKQSAIKAWAKLSEEDRGRVMAAIPTWPFDAREDGKFIPYPASWLNERRWEDEPMPADAKAAKMTDKGRENYRRMIAEEAERQKAGK